MEGAHPKWPSLTPYGSLRRFPSWRKHGKLQNSRTKIYFCKSALLILTVLTNAFHSTNLFCCFSCYQAPTNSVAPYFCIYTTRNPYFLDLLRQRANAWNGGQFTSLTPYGIHISRVLSRSRQPANSAGCQDESSRLCWQRNLPLCANFF